VTAGDETDSTSLPLMSTWADKVVAVVKDDVEAIGHTRALSDTTIPVVSPSVAEGTTPVFNQRQIT
jgi:hypothetical protein